MTDRFNGLVVTLEKDIRSDDAEGLMSAIRHMRGVVAVDGNVSDVAAHLASERVRNELWMQIREVFMGSGK